MSWSVLVNISPTPKHVSLSRDHTNLLRVVFKRGVYRDYQWEWEKYTTHAQMLKLECIQSKSLHFCYVYNAIER